MDSDKIRFIIITLTLVIDGGLHANILIYDKVKNRMERFEPYGLVISKDTVDLDKFLTNKFKKLIDPNLTYINPTSFIKNKGGVQLLSNDNISKYRKLYDPQGFCLAWCYWYLEMRVNNPEPDNIIESSLDQILKSSDSKPKYQLVDYIRTYAQLIDKIITGIMLKIDIPQNEIKKY